MITMIISEKAPGKKILPKGKKRRKVGQGRNVAHTQMYTAHLQWCHVSLSKKHCEGSRVR